MASIDLSTAGIKVGYGVEITAGTKPTSFVKITGIKSIPSFNPEPSTLETTVLEELEWKTYIDGLKDVGGALSFTCNLTEQLMTEWETLMESYDTARAADKRIWIHINIPNLTQGFFFTANPSPLGMPEAGVDAVLEIEVFMTPTYIDGWSTKVTIS